MSIKNYEHCCSTIQALASLGKIEGVVPLLHGPQPCLYQNQVGSMYCRPSNLLTAGTLINTSDIVFGGEESLKTQIRNIYSKYKPKLIVIINTCVPQLIGEDIEGVIYELNDEIPDLKITTCKTGLNFPKSMPLGSDSSWVAVIESFEKREKVPGSVGIVGRTGQDAGNMAGVEVLLKRAGIKTFAFPAGHFDVMEKIVMAETIFPVHITPKLTTRKLASMFGQDVKYIEIPAGIRGSSEFFRGVADHLNNQKLHDLVSQEEKRVMPEFERIRKMFQDNPVRMLLVTGPANEVSIGKIFAEFGAEVFIVPCMKNEFIRKEKEIMQERYGVTFVDQKFDTLDDLIDEIRPTVVSVEYQGQVESMTRLIPTIINMLYLCEYGYDYAIDLGGNFFKNLKQPIYEKWQGLLNQYGVKYGQ